MTMFLCNGSTIKLSVTPLNIPTHKGYLKSSFNSVCMDWKSNNTTDALEWILGDWKKGQTQIHVNEPVQLISKDWLKCAIPQPTGFVEYGDAWSRPGMARPNIIFRRNGVENMTTPVCNGECYWIEFEGNSTRWGTPNNLYYISTGTDNVYPVLCFPELVQPMPTVSTNTVVPVVVQVPKPSQVYVDTSFPVPKQLYLTVDDSCSVHTLELVNYINAQKIPCVFFMNGSNSQKYPDALKAIVSSPYITVGVHTWSHANMNNQLTPDQVRKEIKDTITLIENAFVSVGKKWPLSPRLFRFPFTDGGSGYKAMQLQGILQEFGFQEHKAMQKAIYGTGLGINGLFLQDGLFVNKSTTEFMAHVKESFLMFKNTFPAMFEPMVLGSHDLIHETTLLKFLVARNVQFLDPVSTF